MAFLATRFPSRHRNLGRRRRGVRAKAFAADLATVPFLADNPEPEPVCVAYWRRIWVAASAAPQQTATCVLRRLNTEICPAKGPVAVGAGVLSLVAVRLPGSPLGGGPDVRFRGARRFRRVLLLVPALPGGRRKFLRRASPSWAGAPVGCHRWRGCGAAVVLHRAAVSRAPAQFSSTQK